MTSAVEAMLGARSVAIVGASARPGSFGSRMVGEVLRGRPDRVALVNPRYNQIDGRPCVASLGELDEPPDLVMLGVGDAAVAGQLKDAAALGARSAVVFGNLHAPGLRAEVASIARDAGMALCGGGCMGFVNVTTGLRATGYVEPETIPAGSVSLITHSGSVFSALLRTRRAIGYRVAVSSGQELVTSTADYLEHVLADDGTGIVALMLETMRDGPRLRAALRRAADQDVDVVLLAVGGSSRGAEMVAAHSGAIAGDDAAWQALCADTGALRVADLGELSDTVELLALARRRWGRRARPGGALATVHDSGAERALTVDLAEALGVGYATLGASTVSRLGGLLDDGLIATNPLDVWGNGADTRLLFTSSLEAMATDSAVGAVALAVDLVPEFDGDTSYRDAVLDAAAASPVPVAVLANLPSAIDDATAAELRAAGVAVLEGTRSGLVAVAHLLREPHPRRAAPAIDRARQARWLARLGNAGGQLDTITAFALLADYGIPVARSRAAASAPEALAAATAIRYPVVLKTAEPGVAHKSDVGGVQLGVADVASLVAAYARVAELGPRVVVSEQAHAGAEFSVGLVADAQLGPLLVLAAGGVLIELLADRAVALPPVDATAMLSQLRAARLLDGFRGAPPADREALLSVVRAVSQLALELGDAITALDVNPVIVSPDGAVAVDALVLPRRGSTLP
jgi:acyl-CoA synthetase (NDP forming)